MANRPEDTINEGFQRSWGYWQSLLNQDIGLQEQINRYYDRLQRSIPIPEVKVYQPNLSPEYADFSRAMAESSRYAYRATNVPMPPSFMYPREALPLGIPRPEYLLPPSAQVYAPALAGGYNIPQTPFGYTSIYRDPLDALFAYKLARARASLTGAESFTTGLVSGGVGMAVGTMVGGLPGAVVGLLAGVGTDLALQATIGLLKAPFAVHMREAERMYQATRQFMIAGPAMHPMGVGIAPIQAAELGFRGQILAERAGGLGYRDIEEIIKTGGQYGLFTWTQDLDAISRNMRSLVKLLGRIAQMTNDPDFRRHLQNIGQLQQIGLLPSEATALYSNAQMAGRLTNISYEALLQTSGAYGAQTFGALNMLPGVGIIYGINARAAAQMGMATGAYSPKMAAYLGGPEGIAQRIVNQQASFINTFGAFTLPSFLTYGATGLEIDKNKLMSYLTGGMTLTQALTGQAGTLADIARVSGRPYTSVLQEYLFKQDLLQSEQARLLGQNPLLMDVMMGKTYLDIQKMMGGPGAIDLETVALLLAGGEFASPEAKRNALAMVQRLKNPAYLRNMRQQILMQAQRENIGVMEARLQSMDFIQRYFSPESTLGLRAGGYLRMLSRSLFEEPAAYMKAAETQISAIESGVGMYNTGAAISESWLASAYKWLINPQTGLYRRYDVEVIGYLENMGAIERFGLGIVNMFNKERLATWADLKTKLYLPYYRLWQSAGTAKFANAEEELKYQEMVRTFVTYAKSGMPVEVLWDAISKQYFGGRELTENEKSDIMAKIKGAASNLPQGSTYNMLNAWMVAGKAISQREADKVTEYRNEAATILRESMVDEFSQKYGLSLMNWKDISLSGFGTLAELKISGVKDLLSGEWGRRGLGAFKTFITSSPGTIALTALYGTFSTTKGFITKEKEKSVVDTLLTALQGKSLTTENIAQAILTLQETYGEDVTRTIVTGMGGIEGIKNVMMGYQAFMVAPTVLGQLAKETGMKAQELGRITSTGTPEDVIELVTKKFESAPEKKRALSELVRELRSKGYSEDVIRRTVLETAEKYMERSVPQYLEQPLPGEEKLVGAPQWGQLSDTLDKLIKDLTELQNVTKGIKDSNIKREEKKE